MNRFGYINHVGKRIIIELLYQIVGFHCHDHRLRCLDHQIILSWSLV